MQGKQAMIWREGEARESEHESTRAYTRPRTIISFKRGTRRDQKLHRIAMAFAHGDVQGCLSASHVIDEKGRLVSSSPLGNIGAF